MTSRFLLLALSAVILAGCATARERRLEKIPDQIEKGVTTRAEVRKILGEPNWKSVTPSGETWIYGDRPKNTTEDFVVNEAIGVGSAFIPVPFAGTAVRAILFAGGANRRERTQATVDFDRRGVVSDYTLSIP